MTNIFPTDFSDKTTPVAWDKVMGYDSVADDNKNLTVDWIATTAFADRDTDDLSEWATNKYASTTNVNAAWATMNTDTTLVWNGYFLDDDTMAWDDATKIASQQSIKAYVDLRALKSNVLELDNTDSFTPTADYEPATKAYVDTFPIPSASETVEWKIELATDAEVAAWTDTTRSITPKTLIDNYDIVMPWTTATYYNDTDTDSTTNTSFTTVKTYDSTVNAIFYASVRYLSGSSSTWDFRVLINGISYFEVSLGSLWDETSTWFVYVSKWDTIDIQAKVTSWTSVWVANTSFKWNK